MAWIWMAMAIVAGGAAPSVGAGETETMQHIHERFSAECFNQCWTLIDKPNRSPGDVEDMILLANASLWHWKQRSDCAPVNLSVGYWQLSRVYALAGDHGMAKFFGERCLDVGQENKLAAFYLGYAYEALARAEVLRGTTARAKEFLAKARERLREVTDEEERKLLEANLADLEKGLAGDSAAGGGD